MVLLLILLVAFSAARLILWAWWIRIRNARMKKYDELWLKNELVTRAFLSQVMNRARQAVEIKKRNNELGDKE